MTARPTLDDIATFPPERRAPYLPHLTDAELDLLTYLLYKNKRTKNDRTNGDNHDQ